MRPPSRSLSVVVRPHLVLITLFAAAVAVPAVASAQPAKKKEQANKDAKGGGDDGQKDGQRDGQRDGKKGGGDKDKVMDFSGLNFEGRLRTPQLLYFLDRAAEELERASLERRSFIPEMVRSIDEEDL